MKKTCFFHGSTLEKSFVISFGDLHPRKKLFKTNRFWINFIIPNKFADMF